MAKQKMTKERFEGIKSAIAQERPKQVIMGYWNIKHATYSLVNRARTFDEYVKMRQAYSQPKTEVSNVAPKPKAAGEVTNEMLLRQIAAIAVEVQHLSDKIDRIKRVRW